MKNFIVIFLLLVSCVPTFAVTRKKAAPKKKQVEKVVDKHPGQFRNTKVWNIKDCDKFKDNYYVFIAKPSPGQYKVIQLDSIGDLFLAYTETRYTDGQVTISKNNDDEIKKFIKIVIKNDTLDIVDYSYSHSKKFDLVFSLKSNNNELPLLRESSTKQIIALEHLFINGVKTTIDPDHEYRNPKDVWSIYKLLCEKFSKLYEYNNDNDLYHYQDRDIDSYIRIAQDDFQYYKKMGYLDE